MDGDGARGQQEEGTEKKAGPGLETTDLGGEERGEGEGKLMASICLRMLGE